MRFDPPPFDVSEELAWALGRAFGPEDAGLPRPRSTAAAVDAAERLELVERLVHRCGAGRLRAELGDEAAGRLTSKHRETALSTVRLIGQAHRAALAAREASIPVVFLKFAALDLGGHVAAGSRGAVDVDILASPARARSLQAALIRAGWTEPDQSGYEHQLRPLFHPLGGWLEVHLSVLGVRLEKKFSATLDQLESRGLLRAAEGLPAGAFVPAREVLTAHALAHGLAQHGLAPRSYPLFRMTADLIDLGFTTAPESSLEAVGTWLDRTLSPDEISEALALCRALRQGAAAELARGNEPGSALLRHMLAGSLDAEYESSLRVARLLMPLSDRPRFGRLASSVWHALWPTRSQMELIYGPAPSALRRSLRRIWRPFDLLRRSRGSRRPTSRRS